ncbi:MAG: VOC family protein [Acetobacteraceae bacterium]
MSGHPIRLDHVGLTVADLTRTAEFYVDALGFERVGGPRSVSSDFMTTIGLGKKHATAQRLRLGLQEIELVAFGPPGRPYPEGSTAADLWFQHLAIVTNDMANAYARVKANGTATAITQFGPQLLPPASGGVTAWKFRDPDGHPLELIQFPPGGGPAVWHDAPPHTATIGIDHSAISVADIARSTAFYEGVLGLVPGPPQINRGMAQERLDAVPDATAGVAALTPPGAATPHLELLGYLTPRGRAMPSDMRADDIAASRLVFAVHDPTMFASTAGAEPTSPSPEKSRLLLRDPDGHFIVLTRP